LKKAKSKPPASRQRILDAALHEFSTKGLDGARVDEIARASAVNKNMIYHYFKSKEQLFIAVLEGVYEAVRARQQDLVLRDLDPVSAMRRLIERTADIWIELPEFNRLLASENLHEARHVRQSSKIIGMYNPLIQSLRSILDRGVADGVFRSNIDPVDLYISITSLSAHYVAHRFTFEAIFKTKLMTPKKLQHRKEGIADMVLRYLQK
jgi:TetR/AcrR family transcriptional regulator